MKTQTGSLQLHVGFLLEENVGFSCDFGLAEEQIVVADDLELDALHGTLRLTRTLQGVYAEGELHSKRERICVRCLREFPVLLSSELAELYNYPPIPEAEFVISEGGILNFAPLIRELILLDEPLRPICKIDCKGLCPVCGHDLNQSDCYCHLEVNEPQWSAFGALLERSSKMDKRT